MSSIQLSVSTKNGVSGIVFTVIITLTDEDETEDIIKVLHSPRAVMAYIGHMIKFFNCEVQYV